MLIIEAYQRGGKAGETKKNYKTAKKNYLSSTHEYNIVLDQSYTYSIYPFK